MKLAKRIAVCLPLFGLVMAVCLLFCSVGMNDDVLSVPNVGQLEECSLSVDRNECDFEDLLDVDDAFSDKEIESVKPLIDFNGELFYDVECFPAGYLIVHYDTFVPFEYSTTAVSPYHDAEGVLIYGAPTYYYQQTSMEGNSDDMACLTEIMTQKEVFFDAQELAAMRALDEQNVASVAADYESQEEEAKQGVAAASTVSGNALYIENYEYISEIEDFAYNVNTTGSSDYEGDCTYISAAIILYYNYRQFNEDFIDSEYVTENGFTEDLVDELLDIGSGLGIGRDTDALEIKDVMEAYTEERVPEATHYSMLLSTSLNIDLCFYDDKPVMLSGSFEDVSSDSGNVSQTITAFGRSENSILFYTSRYYYVNYGWAGYTNVAIQDNIFLNPIGCMYNLNPEG